VTARPGQIRQLVVGLVALPLTALPFVAYANLTPEGRLVRDRAVVALAPPTLPRLSPGVVDTAATAAPRYEGAVMALAYHGIGSASDSEGGFVVSPKRFGEHLATLQAAGMNTVTAAEVAAAFTGGPALPPNAVMISFDDGRADAMMFADPLLKQAGMKATMFVIAGAASEPGVYYASWDKIEGYAGSGRWDIESHSAEAHREQATDDAGSLPALTSRARGETLDDYRARVRADLREAGAAIEKHVGRHPVAFAYPFGAYGADRSNDPEIIDVLREEVAGEYAVAFQQDDQDTIPLLTPDQDPLRLRRLEVENWSGLQLLQRIGSAATPGTPAPDLPSDPAELALPAVPTPAGAPAGPPSTSTTLPRTGGTTPTTNARRAAPDVLGSVLSAVTVPPVAVTVPPVAVTLPPVTVTLPGVTLPPVTVPPVTTTPPTTKPPTTTTRPTSPPTTACKPAGKSGKCLGGG
jgi:peptidoglycan/xylan/chitin deacetylase (PgdA/CDA1 family)